MSIRNNVPTRTYLTEEEQPKTWYNLMADMPNAPAPYLHADGKTVMKPEEMYGIFAKELIDQEFSKERYIPIPQEVYDIYKMFRATPLYRAYALEKHLGTPARLYYKYEGLNPSGSHKLNSAIPQAYYNKKQGITKMTTETGAGQWGTALSVASAMLGMECDVYMVKCSGLQKPQRRELMKVYGANVYLSPSNRTESGRKILESDPECPGSLGIAISEAVEIAAQRADTNYVLGSVLNHVLIHQSIIGQEAKLQMEKVGEYPDMVISCCGGGSNFAGIAFSFLGDVLRKEKSNVEFIGVEPEACPTMTQGEYRYDFGDVAHFTPMMLQYTLGSDFMPPSFHAGGLRYHGMSSLVSQMVYEGYVKAKSVKQKEVFEAAVDFARHECIMPAPESGHTLAQVYKEALKCKQTGEEKVILFNVSGHGNFDMAAYEKYFNGELGNE